MDKKLLAIILVAIALGLAMCTLAAGGLVLMQALPGTATRSTMPTPVVVAVPGTAQQDSIPGQQLPPPQLTSPQVANLQAQAEQEDQLLNAIYEQAMPSVVNIRVTSQVPTQQFQFQIPGFPTPPAGQSPQGPGDFYQQGEGSGFVIDNQGHIVTNNHVVAGASQIQVTFWNDVSVPAKVIGTDPDSDLAVIQVTTQPQELHPIALGDSSSLKVGQKVIAIGNPFGLEGTLTTGVISAIGRSVPTGSMVTPTGGQYTIPDVIQTDAAINPGNSGGPLLDIRGQVVGVNFMIESESGTNSGVGFAIPVNIVKRVTTALISSGRYAHPYLGISGTTVTQDLASAANLPVDYGAQVVTVVQSGPAAQAGLQPSNNSVQVLGQQVPVGGDIITAIDGQPVRKFDDLTTYLGTKTEVGQTVRLTIMRGSQQTEIAVKLGERPATSRGQQSTP